MTLTRRGKNPAVVALTSLLTFVLLAGTHAAAEPALATTPKTIFVGGAGADNSRDGLTAGTSKATIQAAINLAASGDTVRVASGTYQEQIAINKSITLLGPNDAISPNSSDPLVPNASEMRRLSL
jgi:pectin methylesterase-like acyl-CoA thioesterase